MAGSTSVITYTINGGSTQTATGVVANSSGIGNFATGNLTAAENGKILKIIGITVTSATPSCSAVFSQDVTLNVNSDSGGISLNGGAPTATNGTVYYCPSNLASFSIAPVLGATSYTWVVPAGWTNLTGQGTTSITVTTGTSSESGNVIVTANTFCPSSIWVALSGITPNAPTVSQTPLTCAVPTGTITVTSPAPQAGRVYTVTGTNPVVAAITSLTGEFTGLAAGDYIATYQDGSGCVSTATAAISLQALVTKTWNAGWTPAGVPTLDNFIVFDGPYSGPSVDGCSCTVKATANITIGSGQVLKLVNELNVETGAVLTFLNGASLVQKNDVTNSGIIHYNRTTSAVQDFDYVYWSSPVAGQTLGALSSLSDKYWSWGVDNWVKAEAGDVMAKGQGYIARVPRYTSPQNVEFVGVPFNGPVTVLSKGDTKGNLVGNPYPCAVDAVKFINTNIGSLDVGTLYFWTHVGNRTLNGSGTQYVYSSNDYASFNSSGGLKAVNGGEIPNGTIAAGQSVFVIGKGTGDLVFTNSMRLDATNAVNDNSQFFKQANTKKAEKVERNRVWLNLTNDGGAFKQLLVGYITGASNGFDKSFDGPTFNGNTFVDFYSINDSKNYAIQGRGLPFDPEDEVPLGYKTTIAGTFQIGIDEADGSMVNQEIYLEDKTANTIHNLTKGPYSFTTAIGEFKDRFVLRYTNTSKLGTDDVAAKGKGVVVSVKNSQIKINSFEKAISSVKVYDLKGSLLYEKDKADSNEFVINHLNSSSQFMIVMVQLEDGNWVSEEIIFHD